MDIVAERFIKEIDQLTTVPGLGKFNINTSSKDLNLPNITAKSKETAPSSGNSSIGWLQLVSIVVRITRQPKPSTRNS
jgi:hypothetical protein